MSAHRPENHTAAKTSDDIAPDAVVAEDRALRFVEKRMSRNERAEFLRDVAAEPQKVKDLKELERVVELLHRTPPVTAPPNFLRDVQGRIRHRTRGRYYGMTVTTRLPWEALINAMLLFALLVVYFFGMPVHDQRVLVAIPAATFEARASDANTAIAVIHPFGEVQRIERDGAVLFTVAVAPDRVAALELELALYPYLSIDNKRPDGAVVQLTIRLHKR